MNPSHAFARAAALFAAVLLSSASATLAHGLWIEPGQGGYKVFFREPENGLREKKDKFGRFQSLKAWNADGSEAKLEIREDHLFAATAGGGFTAANLDSPVREPKEGMGAGAEVGPMKGYQFLRFAGDLAAAGKPAAPLFLDMVPEGKGALRFDVLKGGKHEILAPWPGLYILKAVWKDRTPGEFQGKKFAVANHAAVIGFLKP